MTCLGAVVVDTLTPEVTHILTAVTSRASLLRALAVDSIPVHFVRFEI